MTLAAARRDFVSRAWALQVPGGLVPYRRSGSARTMRGQVGAQTRTDWNEWVSGIVLTPEHLS